VLCLRRIEGDAEHVEDTSVTLASFLATEDLDDLLRAAMELDPPSDHELAVVRSTLHEWRNEQAVANLLFYPHFIPADLRLETVIHGLDEQRQRYYVLAAVVGLQDLDIAALSKEVPM